MVEESIHVKFDDKEHDNEMSELSKNFAGIQISGSAPEARKDSAFDKNSESPEVAQLDAPSEAAPEDPEFEDPPEVDYYEIAHDGSQEASEDHPEPVQSKTNFKYKAAHPETLIIGNKNNPMKTRSELRQ